MGRRSQASITQELDQTRKRLNLYLKREETMLSDDSVQMYSIGSRSLQRYQTALADVQKTIEQLRKRVRELEAELAGQSPRRALGVVPRDW